MEASRNHSSGSVHGTPSAIARGGRDPAARSAERSLAPFLAVARSEFILEPLHVLAVPSSNEPAQEHADAKHDPDAQKPQE
jgi:hypothetical protein